MSQASDTGGLVHYLDGLVEELRALVPQAVDGGDVEAIHQARVATRRIRAAVDLLEPTLSKSARKALKKTLRTLRRRLGVLRDLDVMSDHLGGPALTPNVTRGTAWLVARFADDRAAALDDARGEIRIPKVLGKLGGWWGVRQEVIAASEAVTSLLTESLHKQLDAFGRAADELQTRAAFNSIDPSLPRVDPHAVRIAGKALRYTLEMAQIAGHALPGNVFKAFKKMQESLGTWHDYVVLTEQAMQTSTAHLLAHHDADLQREILLLAQATLKKSQVHLAKFSEKWAADGVALTNVIRDKFPLSTSRVEPTDETPPLGKSDDVSTGPPAADEAVLEFDVGDYN